MLQFLVFIGFFFTASAQNLQNETRRLKDGKALSVFQVVRFPNTICSGTGSYNGTCYTSSECTAKGGTQSGSCANGFGVCCVFTLGCGGTAAQNCTYFVSSSPTSGACSATICKCSSDICQLRLDFNSFVIAGPSTDTTVIGTLLNGALASGAGADVTLETQCLTDTFSVTGPGGSVPPVICGTNNLQHVYVDASTACNTMNFQLGQTGVGTNIPTRQWEIKVTQISCLDVNRAPSGCTQYYTGRTGEIQSFNYANKVELANQHQTICVRREEGYCRVCWYAEDDANDFKISGTSASMGSTVETLCCGYGSDGAKSSKGFECVMIPGASKKTGSTLKSPSICGQVFVTAVGGTAASVCSKQLPFQLTFLSDAYTFDPSAFEGFKLKYELQSC